MVRINKDDLTFKEYNNLCPTYGLFDGVNYSETKYYRDENGLVYEMSICLDGSLNKRVKELENIQRKRKIMKNLGL